MSDNYVKGRYDKGDLVDKFAALVIFDNEEAARNFLKVADKTNVQVATVHEIIASHYDIDFNIHKLLMYPDIGDRNGA